MKKLLLVLIGLVFISLCTQQTPQAHSESPQISLCIQICTASTQDLSNGTCLSDNNTDWNIDDWVCDVAHSPRQDVDNLPENQCQEYREGKAHHFVEVDPNCNLIRAV